MNLFAFAATLAIPPDKLVPRYLTIRNDPGELILNPLKIDGLKRKLSLQLGSRKVGLVQTLSYAHIPIGRPMLLSRKILGNETDLSILLACFNEPAVHLSLQWMPVPLFNLGYRFLELRSHIGTDCEFDHPEASIHAFSTIPEKVVLISGSVRTEKHLLNSRGKKTERLPENSELLKTRRHVAVPKFRMQNQIVLEPIRV
jgi:hypothetical protein